MKIQTLHLYFLNNSSLNFLHTSINTKSFAIDVSLQLPGKNLF